MVPESATAAERERRLGEALASWIEAAEAGRSPDSGAWLARYPELGAELVEFFAAQKVFPRVAATRSEATPAPERLPAEDWKRPSPSFDDFEVGEELGRGGMSVVYKARQVSLNRPVALKVLRGDQSEAEETLRRFRNEAELLARLDHPNIVRIHATGEQDGRPFFVMPLLEGGSLAGRLARFGADPRAAARLVAVVAHAVHHAHQRMVLHRDLKPSNILLDAAGQPYITDFGLARRLETDSGLTQSGAVVGTPSYMAPEQTMGDKAVVTTAADVYALGAILYALLTGRPPVQGETVYDTIMQVREASPERPRRRNPKVSRDLETICLKCLEKDAGRRYGSAEALAEDIERWLKGEPITARPGGPVSRAVKWARRRPVPAALGVLLAAAVVLCLGLSAYVLVRERDHANERARSEADKARSIQIERDVAKAKQREAESANATTQIVLAVNQDSLLRMVRAGRGGRKAMRDLYESLAPLLQSLERAGPANTDQRMQLGKFYILIGEDCRQTGELDLAAQALNQALRLFTGLPDDSPSAREYRAEHAAALQTLALILQQQGKVKEADDDYGEARTMLLGLVKVDKDNTLFKRYLAHTEGNLAALRMEAGRWDEAVDLNKHVVDSLEKLPGALPEDRQRLGKAWDNLGVALSQQAGRAHEAGQDDRAVELAVQARTDFEEGRKVREALAKDAPDDLGFQADLAKSLHNLGTWDLTFRADDKQGREEGIGLLRRAADIDKRLLSDQPFLPDHAADAARDLLDLGQLLYVDGDQEGSDKSFMEAARVADEAAGRFLRSPKVQNFFLGVVRQSIDWYGQPKRPDAARTFLDNTVAAWQERAKTDAAAQDTLKALLELQQKLK